ncbi:MAG: hypothetical protein HC771_11145 [Synechococcales cyanobacterium CRU_2_2]|nr:hypothetical protein [Synechococcales cyanobacterium CRU_2_2]
MAFSDFKDLGKVVQEFQIRYIEADFVQPATFPLSDYFREELRLTLQDAVVNNSEFAICENLVYPILKEVWKAYRDRFLLWSHEFLTYDSKLSGYPEYILARRSPLGKVVFDKPYLLLVEAKQDDFEGGWAQCLAEMIAAQRLNQSETLVVYGVVSNGDRWQIGNLTANQFTRNVKRYGLQELDDLFAALNWTFAQCDRQLEAYSAA